MVISIKKLLLNLVNVVPSVNKNLKLSKISREPS